MLRVVRHLRNSQKRLSRARRAAAVNSVLSVAKSPDTSRAEADFDRLQLRYKPLPEYGYDAVSLLERAANRVARILRYLPREDRKLRILDVGAGDGTLGVLFAATGNTASLCDIEDWRAGNAKSLDFVAADCCAGLPHASEAFDVVCAFNSFEHVGDPHRGFAELVRVTAPGGLIYLDFGPLYCSPWGLHAYRSLRMPYPQYLFSGSFINTKLTQLGVFDLGKEREELQHLNGWKPSQFTTLWSGFGAQLEEVDFHCYREERYLSIIREYPECFRGRGLGFDDVTMANIRAVFRKNGRDYEANASR